MGFKADWGGIIVFTEKPDEETMDAITNQLGLMSFDEDKLEVIVGDYTNYYEDYIMDALDFIAPIVKSGEIEFSGDGNSQWRFIFKDGEWIEEQGYIYYESELPAMIHDKDEFIGQIIDLIQDTMNNPRGTHITDVWYDKIYKNIEELIRNL